MVCSCCKGAYPHKHDRRNCPMNKIRKKKPKQGPKALEGLHGCMNIFREPPQQKAKKVRRPVEGLADCNLFRRINICGLCGQAGHNRRTCEKQWLDAPEFLGPMTPRIVLQDPVEKYLSEFTEEHPIKESNKREILSFTGAMGPYRIACM